MHSFFANDGKPMKILSVIIDFFVLNIIFLISCIPVFTIGISLISLYYTVVKVLRQGRGYLFREYIHCFKMNFVQGTLHFFLIIFVDAFLCFGIYMVRVSLHGNIRVILMILYLVAMIWWQELTIFVLPLISRFHTKKLDLEKSSFVLAIKYSFRAIIMVFLFLLGVAGMIFSWMNFPFLLFVFPAGTVWIFSLIMEPILHACEMEKTSQNMSLSDEANLQKRE
jgi:uncharacterized membrane protein YesL